MVYSLMSFGQKAGRFLLNCERERGGNPLILLNFLGSTTPEQLAAVTQLARLPEGFLRRCDAPVRIDFRNINAGAILTEMEHCTGLDREVIKHEGHIVILPRHPLAGMIVLQVLEGFTGRKPRVINLDFSGDPPRVVSLVDLADICHEAECSR